jgi:hypothetical protein
MVDDGDELAYVGNELAVNPEGGAAASAFGNAVGNGNGSKNGNGSNNGNGSANRNGNVVANTSNATIHVSPPLKLDRIAPVVLENKTSFPSLLPTDAGAKVILDTERNFRNILIQRRGKLFEDANMVVRVEMLSVRQSGLTPKQSAYADVNNSANGDEEEGDGKGTALVIAAEAEARADGSQTQPGMIVTIENKSNQRMVNVEVSEIISSG